LKPKITPLIVDHHIDAKVEIAHTIAYYIDCCLQFTTGRVFGISSRWSEEVKIYCCVGCKRGGVYQEYGKKLKHQEW